MKKLKLFFMVLVILLSVSCTDNIRAKNLGGTMTIDLPKNQKLINATWKESDLWVLTRDKKAGELPETYKLIEYSTFGVMQGTIIINEK